MQFPQHADVTVHAKGTETVLLFQGGEKQGLGPAAVGLFKDALGPVGLPGTNPAAKRVEGYMATGGPPAHPSASWKGRRAVPEEETTEGQMWTAFGDDTHDSRLKFLLMGAQGGMRASRQKWIDEQRYAGIVQRASK